MEQQALTRLLKLIRHQKLKTSFPMKGLDVRKRWITVNFPLTTQFLANIEPWTPWKRTIQITKNYLAADWRLKKHHLKWSFPNHRLQEKKTTAFCLIYGIMRICAHLKTFYASTTTKTLSQHSKQCRKCMFSITRKKLTCWGLAVHCRIWRVFISSINLPVPISTHLLKTIKTCCQQFKKIWLVVLLSSPRIKL